MNREATYSVVLDRPTSDVRQIVRDSNSYPVWVDGVEDSHIEGDLSGTTVGAVRNFAIGGSRTRQRLVAHSDVDRFFIYESVAPLDDRRRDRRRPNVAPLPGNAAFQASRRRRSLFRRMVVRVRMPASRRGVLG